MPKEAIALGAVDDIMPIGQVARAILAFDARGRARATSGCQKLELGDRGSASQRLERVTRD